MIHFGEIIAAADNRADSTQSQPDKGQEKLGKEQPGDNRPAADPSIGDIVGEMVGYLFRQRTEESQRQYRRKNQKSQR